MKKINRLLLLLGISLTCTLQVKGANSDDSKEDEDYGWVGTLFGTTTMKNVKFEPAIQSVAKLANTGNDIIRKYLDLEEINENMSAQQKEAVGKRNEEKIKNKAKELNLKDKWNELKQAAFIAYQDYQIVSEKVQRTLEAIRYAAYGGIFAVGCLVVYLTINLARWAKTTKYVKRLLNRLSENDAEKYPRRKIIK